MTRENETFQNKFAELQRQAREKPGENSADNNDGDRMAADGPGHVIEELRMHQVELEMQNQQLLEAKEKLEESRRKYIDLYDFAPVGYLTLAPDGKIVETNLTAARMMNTTRKGLVGSLLYLYIQREDRDCLFSHLRKLFKDFGRHTCELRLADTETELYIQLDSVCEMNEKEKRLCRTTLTGISERKKMEKALVWSKNQLKMLSQNLIQAQEKERQRFAVDLHDGVAQLLAAGKLYVQNLMSRFPESSEEYQMLESIIDIKQKALDDTKRIVDDLRPVVLDGMGIVAAIRWLCKQLGNTNPGLSIERRITAAEEEVPENLKAPIFRILQEALSNIIRHSQADNVAIRLEKSDAALQLVIKDNGKGFETAVIHANSDPCRGIGIISMTERVRATGGQLDISSSRQHGTRLTAKWRDIA